VGDARDVQDPKYGGRLIGHIWILGLII